MVCSMTRSHPPQHGVLVGFRCLHGGFLLVSVFFFDVVCSGEVKGAAAIAVWSIVK